MRSDNSQSYPHQISRSLDHHNARAQDAPERRAESKAGGSAWEDSDGALGRKALAAAATAVLAGLAF